jgi:hypothetical protein
VTLVGGALYIALFLDTARRGFIGAPYGDAYDILAIEFQAQDGHDPGLYLWRPHNGHHIVWLRLLTSLDVRVFHGQSAVFALAALLALTAAAAMLAREIWRGVGGGNLGLAAAAVAPLALLTSLNAFDIAGPMNTPYVFVVAFAAAACTFVENASGGWGSLAGVLTLAAAAAMGNSAGLATVPVLMIAIFRRSVRGRLALFWIAGPLLAAVFVATAGEMAVQAPAPAGRPIELGLRAIRYFVGFCGLPWSASSDKASLPGALQSGVQFAATAVSLVLIATGLALAARPAKDDSPAGRLDRLCCSLILFSLAVAAMASLGRVNATPAMEIPVRYAVLLAPLHIGVLVLLLTRTQVFRRIRPRAAAAATAAILTLALGHQILGREVVLRYCTHVNQLIAAFNAGRRSPEMTAYIYPDLRRAEQVTGEMRRRGLYR